MSMDISIDQALEPILYAMAHKIQHGIPTEECVAVAKKELLSMWMRDMEESDRDHGLLNAAKSCISKDADFNPFSRDSITNGDPFPKWKWKMDWCKAHHLCPTLGWDKAEEAWGEETKRPYIKDLAAKMNEIETGRSTCDCCSNLEVNIHAAKLFDFDLDNPPEGWSKGPK